MPSPVLLHEPRSASRVAPWHCRGGADEDIDITGLGNAKHSKTKPAAKIAETRVAFPPVSFRCHARRQPHFITRGRAINGLENKFEVEAELHLPNDDQWGLVTRKSDKIATADFTFDRKAEALEEALDRQVKGRLQDMFSGCSFP